MKTKIKTILVVSILIIVLTGTFSEVYAEIPATSDQEKTALILNPVEYLYGSRYCQPIIKSLQEIGYSVTYIPDENVDLDFIEHYLPADVVYINTHAGYWDTDGDGQPDSIVIATGEKWTEDTTQIYAFEYNHSMIVRCEVRNESFIAFTPELIEYYYGPGNFSDSLIFMATCDAAYDDSMAEPFLDAGASAYMGWKRTTTSWTNRFVSIRAFKLLGKGLTVQQTCRLMRFGGIFNFFFLSRLTYYGDGVHIIL